MSFRASRSSSGKTGLTPPDAPTIAASGGAITLGGTLTITPALTGGPVTSYVATCDGRVLGAVSNGHTFIAADIGDSYTVHAVGSGHVSAESNALSWSVAAGSPTLALTPSSLVVANGRYSGWTDRSGNARNWTQPTPQALPLLGNQMTGQNVANFEGTFSVLQPTGTISGTDLFTNTTAWGFCVFYVEAGNVEVVTAPTFYGANGIFGMVGGFGVLGVAVVSGVQSLLFGTYGAAGQAAVIACPNGLHWCEFGLAGGTLSIRLDGGVAVTATSATFSAGHGMYLGINNNSLSKHFHGDIGALHTFSAQPAAGVLADCRAYYANLASGARQTALITRSGDIGSSNTLLGDVDAGTTNSYVLITSSMAYAAWDITVPVGGSTLDVWMSERGACPPESQDGAVWMGATGAKWGSTLLSRLTPTNTAAAYVKTTVALPAGSYRVFTESSPRSGNTQNLLLACRFATGVTFTPVTGAHTGDIIFNGAGSRTLASIGYGAGAAGALKTAYLATVNPTRCGTLSKYVFAFGIVDWETDPTTGGADAFCTYMLQCLADTAALNPTAEIVVVTLTSLGANEGAVTNYWRTSVRAAALGAGYTVVDGYQMYPDSAVSIDQIHPNGAPEMATMHNAWSVQVVTPVDDRVMVVGNSVTCAGLMAVADFDVANGNSGLCRRDRAA